MSAEKGDLEKTELQLDGGQSKRGNAIMDVLAPIGGITYTRREREHE